MPSHPQPKNPRPHATETEVEQLRKQLLGEDAPAAKADPYKAAREALARTVDNTIAYVTGELTAATTGTEDADALRAMYRSLITAQQRAKRAIGRIPDSAITLEAGIREDVNA